MPGLVDRWNGSSVCCQSHQPEMSTCGQMCRLVDSWNGRICLWTGIDLLTDTMVDLFVTRIIDLLSDVVFEFR